MYFWIMFHGCFLPTDLKKKKKKELALIKISIVFATEEGRLWVVVMVMTEYSGSG